MKRSILLSLTALLFFTSLKVKAQNDAFSGTWLIKNKVSISGILYSNAVADTIHLAQEGNKMTMNGTTLTNRRKYVQETQTNQKMVDSLSWNGDNSGFIITVKLYDNSDHAKLIYQRINNYSLTNGELVLDRRDENFANGEIWEVKATYTK